MKLELDASDMAVVVGGLSSHIDCINRDMDRPDMPEKHRELYRESIKHINKILDRCGEVIKQELNS